jgi:hypothetical protein
MPAAKPYVLAVIVLEPAAASPLVVLLPPKAEPQAVQRWSNVPHPDPPPLAWEGWEGGCLGEDRGISERNVGRQICLFVRRKADRRASRTDTAAAVDEWIEHECEELVGQLQGGAFGSGTAFAVQLRQRAEQRRTRNRAET